MEAQVLAEAGLQQPGLYSPDGVVTAGLDLVEGTSSSKGRLCVYFQPELLQAVQQADARFPELMGCCLSAKFRAVVYAGLYAGSAACA